MKIDELSDYELAFLESSLEEYERNHKGMLKTKRGCIRHVFSRLIELRSDPRLEAVASTIREAHDSGIIDINGSSPNEIAGKILSALDEVTK